MRSKLLRLERYKWYVQAKRTPNKMWHEARKQERKIRGMLVDYRRRAERRQDFYEKIVRRTKILVFFGLRKSFLLSFFVCLFSLHYNRVFGLWCFQREKSLSTPDDIIMPLDHSKSDKVTSLLCVIIAQLDDNIVRLSYQMTIHLRDFSAASLFYDLCVFP